MQVKRRPVLKLGVVDLGVETVTLPNGVTVVDDETQALLSVLAEAIGTSRVRMLVNYRPEYRHQWGGKTYYTQLRLDPLGRDSAGEMLTALLGEGAELMLPRE